MHVAGERTDLIERRRERDQAVAGDPSVRRLERDDPAKGPRLPDTPAGIAAEGERRLAGGDRRGGAAARAAGHAHRVPGVAGRTESGVLGAASEGELIAVGLA